MTRPRSAVVRHVQQPPFGDHLPAPLFFRTTDLPADSAYPWHQHAWGEFVFAYRGVMEVKLQDHHYLAPPQYGVWLPPRVAHVGLNRLEASFCSIYISPPWSDRLPLRPCALTVGPLVRALLDHLREHPRAGSDPVAHDRLLEVLVDQLALAPPAGSYLPGSDDTLLAPVLRALEAQPGDNRSVADWARTVHTTERTLARRCQRELGMPLAEWRQRLRVVRALPRLEAGEKVEALALDLGYASASAFIAMFHRLMGMTPSECRKGVKT